MKGQKTQNGTDYIVDKENVSIHSLGTLDWKIYKCITNDHVTDEVIITEEQLVHIRERHPEAYQDMLYYVKDILDNPDYILKDKRPNSGLIIRKIKKEKGMGTLLILRISTSEDKEGYKNSVLTGWKISEKRLTNYLRSKEIIYKRE